MKKFFQWCAGVAFVATIACQSAFAAGWGDLTGQLVYDGDAPTPKPVQVTKDVEVCGKFKLVDESLTVNPENKGIANVMVYLIPAKGKLEAHADYEATAKDKVMLDNLNCRFEPQVVLLRTTQKLVIGNKDSVGHNTKIDTLSNQGINPIVPAGGSQEVQFAKAEKRPTSVSCNIHPWMTAKVLIQDHPYMAVTDADGKFTIKNLPAGKVEIQFRHDKYIEDVKVNGKAQSWKKGKAELTITDGKPLDLGAVLVSPKNF